MTFWMILNAVLSLIAGGFIAYELLVLPQGFSAWERTGVGLIGAGCVMRVAPILWPQDTPFDNWAGSLLLFGLMIFFIARRRKHYQANVAAKRQARQHLKQRELK